MTAPAPLSPHILALVTCDDYVMALLVGMQSVAARINGCKHKCRETPALHRKPR